LDNLFEFIFGNMALFIIVVGFLIKMLGGQSKKSQEENPHRSTLEKEVRHESVHGHNENQDNYREMPVLSAEEQHQNQLERLRQQYQVTDAGDENIGRTSHMKSQLHRTRTKRDSKILNQKLTRKRLQESVVMAEVLGPPRARSPYRNVASRRMSGL